MKYYMLYTTSWIDWNVDGLYDNLDMLLKDKEKLEAKIKPDNDLETEIQYCEVKLNKLFDNFTS